MTEQTQASLGGPGRPGHLGLEELAALADGRCRSADAARVRAHLASCEECYEVFLETVQLLEDEEGPKKGEQPEKVLTFPFNKNLKPHLWLAAAVLVVAVPVVFFYKAFQGPSLSVAALTAQTGKVDKDEMGKLAWGERTRGIGSHSEDPSFRLGVELLNLQVALKSGDQASADAAAAAVNGLLDSLSFLEPKLKDYYKNLRLQILAQRPETLNTLSGSTAKEAKALQTSDSVTRLEFDLGSWAEAGRLAAYTHKKVGVDPRSAGYFFKELSKEESLGTPEGKEALRAVMDILMTIEKRSMTARALSPVRRATSKSQPADNDALKKAFDQILRAYYPQGERGGL